MDDSQLEERKKQLSEHECRAIFDFLSARKKNPDVSDKLIIGTIPAAASRFKVSETSIRKLYNRGCRSVSEGTFIPDITARHAGRSGRKKALELDTEAIMALPLTLRQNIRSTAHHLNVSKSSLHRRIKEGGLIRPHTSAIKPFLTEQNMLQRVQFCISHVDLDSSTNVYNFDLMMNTVHIDEKWFYLTRTEQRYYLAIGQEPPHRTAKSKNFITKVMLLDLGFFRAIQSLQHQLPQRGIDDLIRATEKAFMEIESTALNNVFLTLHGCMLEIMTCNGGNNYRLPHIGKASLRRSNSLPTSLTCPVEVVNQATKLIYDCVTNP